MYQPLFLKYDYNDLEPFISKNTLETHYNSHYLKYLNKLNEILVNNDFKFQFPVEELFQNIDIFPIKDRADILYNAGGVINHELYFDSMVPILAIDIWEHAYYLDYKNNRKNYIENFIKLINFDEVNKKYKKILNFIK